MKTMISNKEMMTIVTSVGSGVTMMTLKTIIINREMMTFVTIASTPEIMVTILRITSYRAVDIHV